MGKPTDLVQGTLDMLILKTIFTEPKHGWAIARRIQQVSQEALLVQQGCMPPATMAKSPGASPGCPASKA
jgi:PadR family transcriptional regulator